MGFLCVLALGGVHARCGGHEFCAVQLGCLAACGGDCLLAQCHRVGTHVGDITVFVEALRHLHGHAGGETQLTCGFLLQGGGGERRCRAALVRLGLNGAYGERGGLQGCGERAGGFLIQVGDLGGVEGAVVGEVLAGGDAVTVYGDQLGVEAFGGCGQEASGQVPVVGGDECHAFAFAFNDEAGCDGLHATCGEAAADLAPEYGGNFVTVDAVEDVFGQFGGLRKVADMAHGRVDKVVLAEVAANGFDLGGRLHNQQGFSGLCLSGHGTPLSVC